MGDSLLQTFGYLGIALNTRGPLVV
jgi:hypothetical protein